MQSSGGGITNRKAKVRIFVYIYNIYILVTLNQHNASKALHLLAVGQLPFSAHPLFTPSSRAPDPALGRKQVLVLMVPSPPRSLEMVGSLLLINLFTLRLALGESKYY